MNNLFHSLSRHFINNRIPSAEDIYVYSCSLEGLILDEKDKNRKINAETLYLTTMCTLMIEAFKIVNLNNYLSSNYELLTESYNLGDDEKLKKTLASANAIVDKAIGTNMNFQEKFPRKKEWIKDADQMYNKILEIYKLVNNGITKIMYAGSK